MTSKLLKMHHKNKSRTVIGIVAVMVIVAGIAAAVLLRAPEMTQEKFDAQETARVETLNAQTSGLGLDYNADGENENPSLEDIEINDNF